MAVILARMLYGLDHSRGSDVPKLEATRDEWDAFLFAADQVEKSSQHLIDLFNGALSKAVQFEAAVMDARRPRS